MSCPKLCIDLFVTELLLKPRIYNFLFFILLAVTHLSFTLKALIHPALNEQYSILKQFMC